MIAALPTNPAERAKIGIQLRDALYSVYGKEAVNAAAEKVLPKFAEWPEEYRNRETGKTYKPHSEVERKFVYDDGPRYALCKGGEGSGKSTAAIVKTLDRIKRCLSGIAASNDLPHFRRSLWPEMQRWIPWDLVHPKCQYMASFTWVPYAPFQIPFSNGAVLLCGGMDDPESWRGPNVNFALVDEVSRQKTAHVLKVLDGRVRIPGPNGEPPQIFLATTPARNWLFEYFGPIQCVCQDCNEQVEIAIQEGISMTCPRCGSGNLEIDDEREDFKKDSLVVTLFTEDNETAGNLQEGFTAKRRQTLTEAEARVFLEAAWEDVQTGQPFLPSMLWWDACKENLPDLGKREPMVLSVDAATGREIGQSDCFAIVGVTRHPDPERKKDSVAIRYSKAWQAPAGGKIDFVGSELNPGPERELRRLCKEYNVVCITGDPRDLHDMFMRFRRERVAYMKEFGQVNKRTEADTDWLRVIQEKRVAHSGDALLRRHIQNSDRKTNDRGKHLRITQRLASYKVDLNVASSMGSYTALRLNM